VKQRAPELTGVQLGSHWDPFVEQLIHGRPPTVAVTDFPEHAGAIGTTFHKRHLPEAGLALLQTHEGSSWTRGQHLYLWSTATRTWREYWIPEGMVVAEGRFVRVGGTDAVLLTRWNPWWPHGENYPRFWKSLLARESRPAYGLYALDPDSAELRYMFPGRLPVPSPDRLRVACLRSDGSGFHSVHVWSPGADTLVAVVSLWEADPGSGVSFRYYWSADSEVLFIDGTTRGFARSRMEAPRRVRLLYDVGRDELAEINAARR
jgi:hypothetical protein